MARNLTRNTRVYISNQGVLGSCTNLNTWEVKVLDGYTFSQATTTEDININEAGATPIRGTKTYNVAQDPVEVSMSTYIRPYDNAQSLIDAPERILWASLTSSTITSGVQDGNGNYVGAAGVGINQQASGTGMVIDFADSEVNELGKLTIWFHLENTTYRVDNVNISTAEIDFSIEEIATIAWAGMGTNVTELATADHDTIAAWVAGTNYKAVPATNSDSFLRNKLSTMFLYDANTAHALDSGTSDLVGTNTTLEDTTGGWTTNQWAGDYLLVIDVGAGTNDEVRRIASNDADTITVETAFSEATASGDAYFILRGYDIALTGGSLTIENNMNFLTPEELGVVNQPLPGFAGSRGIAGSLTAYLNTGDRGTAGLLQDMLANINEVSNNYNMNLVIGGTTATTKRVELLLGSAQLSVPTVNVEDVIATEITFAGQGSADTIENTDELVVTYHA